MKEYAKVVEKNGENIVVKIEKHSACSKCDKNCGLAGDSHEIEEMNVEMKNTINADEGQTVRLEMREKNLVLASLMLYIFPLLALIAGYFLGEWTGTNLDILSAEVAGIIGSGFMLVIAFVIIKIIDNRLQDNSRFKPEITGIVNRGRGERP